MELSHQHSTLPSYHTWRAVNSKMLHVRCRGTVVLAQEALIPLQLSWIAAMLPGLNLRLIHSREHALSPQDIPAASLGLLPVEQVAADALWGGASLTLKLISLGVV